MNGVVKFSMPIDSVLELTPAQYAMAQEVTHDDSKEIDTQLAWIRQILCEINRDSDKRPTPYTIGEMMLFSTGEDDSRSSKREQTPEEQLAYVLNWTIPQLEAIEEVRQKMEATNT